jgi:hypothetical protein
MINKLRDPIIKTDRYMNINATVYAMWSTYCHTDHITRIFESEKRTFPSETYVVKWN